MSSISTAPEQDALAIINSPICGHCRSLLERPSEPTTYEATIEREQGSIIQSAAGGCRICKRFKQVLTSGTHQELNTRPLRMRLTSNLLVGSLPHWHQLCLVHPDTNQPLYDTAVSIQPALQQMGQALLGAEQVRLVTGLSAGYTRDLECLNRIKGWMDHCLWNHTQCNTPISPTQNNRSHLPARLISVDRTAQVRLVETDDAKALPTFRYATISHRWHQNASLKLTVSSLNDMREAITPSSLLPVFRDAIELCQFLNIPFLWIDQLCILQDDAVELPFEVSQMGSVYENACLNIGAIASAEPDADPEDGLFFDRQEFKERFDPIAIRIRRSDFDKDCYGYEEPHRELNQKVLMGRGWVLQERLLSTRSVYFGEQLQWECAELLASEYFPDGFMHREFATSWGVRQPYKLKTMLSQSRSTLPLQEDRRLQTTFNCWIEIVRSFCKCVLSYESDCFPALSGLAKYFAQKLDDEYMAGLWRKDLFRQLLWYRHVDPWSKEDRQTWPRVYRGRSCFAHIVTQCLTSNSTDMVVGLQKASD